MKMIDTYCSHGRILLRVVVIGLAWLAPSYSAANPVDDLEPGHWYEVPDSHLRDVAPNPIPEGNIAYIIEAWSGGAYDSKRDRLLVWGGGHADYSGNEIYGFDVNELRWHRLTEPSLDVGGDPESGVYPDGKPRARHTYHYIEYLPNVDLFCSIGGAGMYPSGNISVNRTDCFNFNSGQWERKADKPSSSGKGNSVASYDSASGRIYYKSNGPSPMVVYDPTRNEYFQTGKSFSKPSAITSVIDASRRIMVFAGYGDTSVWNINTGEYKLVSTSGSGPAKNSPGLVYDPVTDKIIAWEGGATVYSLDLDTMTWSTHAPAASNSVQPSGQTKNGTFGRFRYVPSKNAFVVVNDIDENVFFYKLSPGGGVVDTTVPSPPTNLNSE